MKNTFEPSGAAPAKIADRVRRRVRGHERRRPGGGVAHVQLRRRAGAGQRALEEDLRPVVGHGVAGGPAESGSNPLKHAVADRRAVLDGVAAVGDVDQLGLPARGVALVQVAAAAGEVRQAGEELLLRREDDVRQVVGRAAEDRLRECVAALRAVRDPVGAGPGTPKRYWSYQPSAGKWLVSGPSVSPGSYANGELTTPRARSPREVRVEHVCVLEVERAGRRGRGYMTELVDQPLVPRVER